MNTTGLPELPANQRWFIYQRGMGWFELRLQRKVVKTTSITQGHLWWKTVDISLSYEWVNTTWAVRRISTAVVMNNQKMFELAESLLSRKHLYNAARSRTGAYPPKSLQD